MIQNHFHYKVEIITVVERRGAVNIIIIVLVRKESSDTGARTEQIK